MGRDPASLLAPGFRFHPTDEELVKFYLKRKVCGRAFRFDAIADADVYKCEPWDLPDKSALKSRDLEWYFFSGLDKKYGNGSKTNRATERGYWKTTGKDRPVYNNSAVVGYKKTLVYHIGRAPKGERTNWVMHEFRLAEKELEKTGVLQDAFVLCRIFQKSGPGPKNGEQHGAPFIEEEWDEDEDVVVTGEQSLDEMVISGDAYLEADDLEKLIDFSIPDEDPLPTNLYYGSTSTQIEDAKVFFSDGQKPFIGTREVLNGPMPVSEQQSFNILEQTELELPIVEYFPKIEEISPEDIKGELDEPNFGGNFTMFHNDDSFLETDDILNSIESDPSGFEMLHEYLADFNACDEEVYYKPPNNSTKMVMGSVPPEEAPYAEKKTNGEMEKMIVATPNTLNAHAMEMTSSSCANYGGVNCSGSKTPIAMRANRMLESIPAPPAYAADFPSKEAGLRLTSAMQSPSPVNVTALVIHAGNTSTTNSDLTWLFNKNGKVRLVFSLSVSQEGGSKHSNANMAGYLYSQKRSAMSGSWLQLIILMVSVLFITLRMGNCVFAK